MSESNFNSYISQDWDEQAIDDGSFFIEKNSYRARIEDRNGNVIHSEVDGISYSPEINSAPSITVDVEPKEELEGTDFLQGYLDVFVDGEILFAGEIVKISTSQREEDWFSIKAHPPARKLSGEVIDEDIENVGTADFIAKTIDKFNAFDDEMHELVDTDQEVLSENIEKINVFRRGEGTIRYNDVGPHGSEISVIYVKLFSFEDVEITVETENEIYQETITEPDDSRYGVWVDITPEGLDGGEYDIEIEFKEENSQLYDWISITEHRLKRIVEPEDISPISSDEFVYGADNNEDFEQFLPTPEDDEPWKIEDDKVSVTNVNYLEEEPSGFYDASDLDKATAGEARLIGGQSAEVGDKIDTIVEFEHDIPAEECAVFLRERFIPEDYDSDDGSGSNETIVPGIEIRLDDEVIDSTIDGATFPSNDEYEWDFIDVLPDDVDYEAGSANLEVEVVETSEEFQDDYGDLEIDTMLVSDLRYSPDDPDYNDLDGPEGHLDGPSLFPEDGIWIETDAETVADNIVSARVDSVAEDIEDGNYASQLSFDGGEEWFPQDGSEENSSSVSAESGFPTQQISARFRLASHGSREDASPKFGFEGHSIDSFSVFVNTDDFDVIDQQSVRENRLSAISSFADESNIIFRWEGDTARIFQAGTRETDVNLKKEDVTSEIDIEDTYASVEVIGSRGITSGVIEAADAPEYIDKHKLKLDRDITNEQDAVRKAREFLADNNQIDFSGEIETLPTKIPVGEVISGENFAHGQDSIVKSGRYSKTRASINVGKIKDVGQKIIGLERSTSSSERYDTSSEFTIPVGEGNI